VNHQFAGRKSKRRPANSFTGGKNQLEYSNLKTNNYLLNIAAIQHAARNGFDDAIILNSRGKYLRSKFQ
jgi:branched-subunit amino acid aminotransferase/4-amino-4-deoxychorismate lyase